ncbi:Os01g0674150 [Oryza sativa Japonica Group]|uniref:Os01g0674150 protein n=2 Tax=Oryza sativa subsp. japonica TaxID=39947 RepID=C7IX21_ORYSJ|nr:hypothetical protein EE612_004937 [Oryza sativa]BAH91229.1 Os01g0674150 [Oryza sativa Japonica Group]BAS73643.1 Os01g0674150 [Oryza sativa Japonica Group]|eukprot:NP_001172499.1 Os01g0674150 [Oryza sativa Japonica Group]
MVQRAWRSASSSPTPAGELHIQFHPLHSSSRSSRCRQHGVFPRRRAIPTEAAAVQASTIPSNNFGEPPGQARQRGGRGGRC